MPALPFEFDVIYWGLQASSLLLGITLPQGWRYFNSNNADSWKLKSLVAAALILDTSCAIFTGDIGHNYFVTRFGENILEDPFPISAILEAGTAATITLSIQMFFAWRVHVLYPHNALAPLLIVLLTLGSFVACILFSISTLKHPYVSNFSTFSMRVEVGAFFSFSLVTDLVTTFFLVTKLYMSGSESLHKGTKNTAHRLIQMVVSRGVLLSIASGAMLIVYIADPSGLYWTPLHFSISRFYVITLIAMLNSRKELTTEASTASLHVSAISFAPASSADGQPSKSKERLRDRDVESTYSV